MAEVDDDIEQDDGYEEALADARHTELKSAMGKVATAINSIQKEDPELKKLISENRDAINNFVRAVSELGKQAPPEVKVETNQDKVVNAVNDLSKILKGVNDRLMALENRPLAVRLKAERNRHSQEIDYVIIEYKKQPDVNGR